MKRLLTAGTIVMLAMLASPILAADINTLGGPQTSFDNTAPTGSLNLLQPASPQTLQAGGSQDSGLTQAPPGQTLQVPATADQSLPLLQEAGEDRHNVSATSQSARGLGWTLILAGCLALAGDAYWTYSSLKNRAKASV